MCTVGPTWYLLWSPERVIHQLALFIVSLARFIPKPQTFGSVVFRRGKHWFYAPHVFDHPEARKGVAGCLAHEQEEEEEEEEKQGVEARDAMRRWRESCKHIYLVHLIGVAERYLSHLS